jgi:predicted DNA-binding protein
MRSATKTKHTQAFTMRIPHETLSELRLVSKHTRRPIVQIVLDAIGAHIQRPMVEPPVEPLFGTDA